MRRLSWMLALPPALALAVAPAGGQDRRQPLALPDLPGFVTLRADFHLHSVFSDGEVWPTVHVREAWRDGLDAVSLTEHVEYRPHAADVSGGPARAYEVARPLAERLSLLLVPGAEITRPAPGERSDWAVGSAHFNVLFLTDAARLDTPDLYDALREANRQGAFVFWDHPGFMDGPAVLPAHVAAALDAGLVQGIEVVNGDRFYPEALQWARERRLTPIASSDAHQPMPAHLMASRRPVTLIFARTRDAAGLREALVARRTVAWRDRELWGDAPLLAGLWNGAVEATPALATPGGAVAIAVSNRSALDFDVRVREAPAWLTLDAGPLARGATSLLRGRAAPGAPQGRHRLRIGITVANLRDLADTPLEGELAVELDVRP